MQGWTDIILKLRFKNQKASVGNFVSVISTNKRNCEGDFVYNVIIYWCSGKVNSWKFPTNFEDGYYLCK